MAVQSVNAQEFAKTISYSNGYSNGYGNGYGSGSSNGYGYGYGYGYGDGCGIGYGDGYGDGNGSGNGYGDGSGSGYGIGGGIKKISGYDVYDIDEIDTIITSIKKNIARGFIVNDDLTFQRCYIAKSGNLFAHGETAREAVAALQEKIFEDFDDDERIDRFLEQFDLDEKYPASVFFDWHNKLTGSCMMGRKNWMEKNGVSMDDLYTVQEFAEKTVNSYGGAVIQKLLDRIDKKGCGLRLARSERE